MIKVAITFTLCAVIPFFIEGKTIVFDVNGTILEKSEEIWLEGAREVGPKYNIIVPKTDTEVRSCTFGQVLKKSTVSDEAYINFILESWTKYYAKNPISPDAKMIPLLKQLKADNHTIIALSSNPQATKKILTATGLNQYFDSIWSVPTIKNSTLSFEDDMFEIIEQMNSTQQHAEMCNEDPIFVVEMVDMVLSYVKRGLRVIGTGWRYHNIDMFNKHNLGQYCAHSRKHLYHLINQYDA